jgi:hypothetical protein
MSKENPENRLQSIKEWLDLRVSILKSISYIIGSIAVIISAALFVKTKYDDLHKAGLENKKEINRLKEDNKSINCEELNLKDCLELIKKLEK